MMYDSMIEYWIHLTKKSLYSNLLKVKPYVKYVNTNLLLILCRHGSFVMYIILISIYVYVIVFMWTYGTLTYFLTWVFFYIIYRYAYNKQTLLYVFFFIRNPHKIADVPPSFILCKMYSFRIPTLLNVCINNDEIFSYI